MPSGTGEIGVTDVAIIGGGLSGSLVAAHLLRHRDVRITVVERQPRLARGVAYSTTVASHLLNVPAGRMSAWPDMPDDFYRWWRRRDPAATPGSFAPRRVYGDYLNEILQRAHRQAPSAAWRCMAEEIVRLAPRDDGALLQTRRGTCVWARRVILALGNLPPADPRLASMAFTEHPAYQRDPWGPAAVANLPPGSPVFLIGTGLTMIDVALALIEQGHRGPIWALSRHGLLPKPHGPAEARPLSEPPRGSIRALTRWLRAEAAADWRSAVDAMRPMTADLWQSLPLQERERFLRHVRPYWDVHRHRMAPAVSEAIFRLQQSGQLRVIAGRPTAIDSAGDWLDVKWRPRGARVQHSVAVAQVINCTGPFTDIARAGDPLLDELQQAGALRPDSLRLGIDATRDGRIIDMDGTPSEVLFVAGPLRLGLTWEAIAVPELRVQAAELAATVRESLHRDGALPHGALMDGAEEGHDRAARGRGGNDEALGSR